MMESRSLIYPVLLSFLWPVFACAAEPVTASPDALKAVADGKMVGTVFQDAKGQGAMAVDLAVQLAQGKQVNHDNYIPFQLVTTNNVAQFMQAK